MNHVDQNYKKVIVICVNQFPRNENCVEELALYVTILYLNQFAGLNSGQNFPRIANKVKI